MHASHIRNSEQWFRSYRVTDKQRIWTINELKLIWSIKFIVMWRTIFFFFLIILILQWYIFNTGDRIYSGYHYECIIMFFFFFLFKSFKVRSTHMKHNYTKEMKRDTHSRSHHSRSSHSRTSYNGSPHSKNAQYFSWYLCLSSKKIFWISI